MSGKSTSGDRVARLGRPRSPALGLLLQDRLAWAPGLVDPTEVDELRLFCRRREP